MEIKKFDSINVVPFIDIILVLLVIVLTTASFVAKGVIPLDLSEAQSAQKLKEKKPLAITIDKDGIIFFNDTKITKIQIETSLEKYTKQTPISISCDKNLKFDTFVYLLDILKNNQYQNIGIITKQK
jgi:biopolymer transport protein ExbD